MSLRHLFEELDIPYTREEAIDFNWMGDPPEPWTAEDEMELPEELQDWSQFETVDGELVAKDFDESKHPRDDHGRFTDGGGSDDADMPSGFDKAEGYAFFHGTSSDLIASIKEHGLLPSGEQPKELGHEISGADKWARDHGMVVGRHNVGQRAGSVYVANEPTLAAAFAKIVVSNHPKAQPIVLAIKIPEKEADKHIVWDEWSNIPNAFRFVGKIPPEWIIDVGRFNPETIPDLSDHNQTLKSFLDKFKRDKDGNLILHAVIIADEDGDT